MLTIYIDADACPVKQEVYRVAERYELEVVIVANSWMKIPENKLFRAQVVSDRFDAADDWIVEQVAQDDIVITGDIPLASRCLEKDARVLGAKGRPFTKATIGNALATRELLSQLRDSGVVSGGPRPFQPEDRSKFLQELDKMIQAIKKKRK